VDDCWDDKLTSNASAPVVPPGNQRGYVSFSMGAIENKTDQTPYCTYPKAPYCAIGFSTNIFINLGNNSRLDGPGFPIFGRIPVEDMAVVDRIYGGYGEVTQLCPVNGTSPFCNGFGSACRGVNMDQFLARTGLNGNGYLRREKPLLSYIHKMELWPAGTKWHSSSSSATDAAALMKADDATAEVLEPASSTTSSSSGQGAADSNNSNNGSK
jgi:hypothetical protein